MKPAVKKQVVQHMMEQHGLSERRACVLVGLSRTGFRYELQGRSDEALRARLKALAEKYPRYGYLLLHGMLKAEDLVINRKRTYRVYTEEGLQVRTKKRKKLVRPRVPLSVPSSANERWSMDFVSDQCSTGRRFRVLNIVDDHTRESVGQLVDTSISGRHVARFLDQIIERRGKPKAITCDNGSEFTSKAMFFWARESQVKLQFIQPGKPTQNAFVESFNGKFRDGCLNQHWFKDLEEARAVIEEWRQHYNLERPHSALGYIPPAVFAEKAA